MIFLGFGLLMTFLHKYGYSAVGFNFLLAAVCIQWAIIVGGFIHLKDAKFELDITRYIKSFFFYK